MEEYNPNKKRKILIVFDDTIVAMLSDKKISLAITELIIRRRKLNTFLAFITHSYFDVPKKTQTKFYTLFYYENSKETRTSAN